MTSEYPKIVLHVITGLNDGGAEAVLFNLVLSDQQHIHKVISLMGPGKYGPLLESAGIGVSYVGLLPSLPSPIKLLRFFRLVRAANADVVQTWMYHADLLGGLAARGSGVKRIAWGVHHSNLDSRGTKWPTRQLVRVNAWLSGRLPCKIISCSNKGAEVHKSIGYPASKMVVVHNGYDTSAFLPDREQRAAIRAEFGIAEDQLLLGCVARYNPQKDHNNLIMAFQKVRAQRPDATLLLIGPGMTEDNRELLKLLEGTNTAGWIKLVGPRTDIPAVMNGLDLHVLSSAFGEAFPNVLSEAMSCGTPCVATDVGDSATIVGDTGRICSARDPDALAEAILELVTSLQDPSLANRCRERIIENFTLEHMIDGYTRVWQSCYLKDAKWSNKQC